MTKDTSRRSPLGRARGLGSAKSGTESWLGEQVAALALIPLSLYVLASFLANVAFGDGYASALVWLRSPFNAAAMILLILVETWYGAHGIISGIVEDYIHHRAWHVFGLIAVKFCAAIVALVGILSVLKILVGA
jgi:succinate dehydrogenase / fumarate reductase membrane anchor subunit